MKNYLVSYEYTNENWYNKNTDFYRARWVEDLYNRIITMVKNPIYITYIYEYED